MCDVVTVRALVKTLHYTCRMRCSMAILTGWNHFVFVFMTGNTGNFIMLGIGLAVQRGSLLVA